MRSAEIAHCGLERRTQVDRHDQKTYTAGERCVMKPEVSQRKEGPRRQNGQGGGRRGKEGEIGEIGGQYISDEKRTGPFFPVNDI